MDGNGRWARLRGLERLEGHKEGVGSVRASLELAVELKIKYLSLFAFSTENWSRPKDEVEGLWNLMFKAIERETEFLIENHVRVLILGNLEQLPQDLQAAVHGLVEATSGGTGTTLIIMMNYSGKWDILQAAKKLALAAVNDPHVLDNLQIQDFDDYLVTAGVPDPDLIIRTSGEQRISNYLLWQGAYSEFYFTDVMWPDFRKEAYREALAEYARRDRRYGKVK